MIPAIKSEIRKLFSVRSTYITMALALGFVLLFAFYLEGWQGNTGSPASELAPTALQELVANGAGIGALFVSIIAILFVAHEYRYNTIIYTLTLNTRRSKVFLAKLLTLGAFAAIFGLVVVGVGVGGYLIGLHLRDATLPAQDFDTWSQLGRVIYYYIGYGMLGILIAAILRSLVAAVATLLLYSITIEPLLGLFLRDNAKYLPVASLDGAMGITMAQATLAPLAAIGVSAAYLAAGLIAAWILFVRRDVS
jgi:ABC-type transport system involved in multi-copper enzyme maturation permease subunit